MFKTIQKNLRQTVNLGLALLFTVFSNLSLISVINPITAHADGSNISSIGSIGGYETPILEPRRVAVDSSGNIYGVDLRNDCVQKFNSSGTYVASWGAGNCDETEGSGNGEFSQPSGITVDSSDNVYVVDSDNYRIQKFDSDGTYISEFGAHGTGDGEFGWPEDIALDSSNNIYVVDTDNHRIQKFDSSGNFLTTFGWGVDDGTSELQVCTSDCQTGAQGSGDGQFIYPRGITTDSGGNIYVADTSNNRIQKFNSDGSYLSQFGSEGAGDGEFDRPEGIDSDSSGNIYVADSSNHRIQKFDSSGNYLSQFGAQGPGDGQFDYPYGVATDPSDNIYVADADNGRIQKFDSSGEHLLSIQASGTPLASYSIAVDGSNNVYTPQIPEGGFPYPGHLLKFSADGELTDTWQYDSGSVFPMVTVASLNALYTLVVDQEFSNPAIVKTDFSGNVITQWDVDSPSLGLALDSDENMYYLNTATGQIEKYSSTGTPLAQYAEPGTGDGQINTNVEEGLVLMRLALDSSGNMYVSDFSEAGGRIQKLNSSGQFISKLELDKYIYGIGISPQDNLYMGGENGGNVIQKRSTSTFELLDEYDASDLSTPFEMFSNPVITETGLIYAANTEAYQINILCDASISSDGCQTADENAGADTDSDTIPDSTENSSPNSGDANNDGTPDSEQANVASMIDPVTGDYAVLEVDEQCSIESLTIVTEAEVSDSDDTNYEYPAGLMDFRLDCEEEGFMATVTQYYYNLEGDFTVRKYTPSTGYFTIDSASISDQTIANQPVKVATYQVEDGGTLDLDGEANGMIEDPAGLAQTASDLASTGQNTATILAIATILTSLGITTTIITKRNRKLRA